VTGSVFSGFQVARIPTPRGPVLARVGGAGPRLLLLHGHPEPHLMWHAVALREELVQHSACAGGGSGEAAGDQKDLQNGEALCRTRTGDPFLTIVSRGWDGRTLAVTVDVNVPANGQVV
jgi:hypothetical protein